MVKKTSQFILSSAATIAFVAVIFPQPVEAARQGPQGQARTSVNKPAGAAGRSGGGNDAARGRGGNNQVNNKQGNNKSVNNSRNVNNVQGGNKNNNVNIDNSRDVNVNVDGGGHYGNHYDHPIAAAAAVTATVAVTAAVVGSIVSPNQMPSSCVQVMQHNTAYMQCGSTWYQPQYQGSSVTYVVVNQP